LESCILNREHPLRLRETHYVAGLMANDMTEYVLQKKKGFLKPEIVVDGPAFFLINDSTKKIRAIAILPLSMRTLLVFRL
jgi:hypothetical protein